MNFKKSYANLPSEDKERILRQYKLEVELSNILRNASKEQRQNLYAKLYNKYFKSLPDHPMMQRKNNFKQQTIRATRHTAMLLNFINQNDSILEIGCGDCSTAFEVCNHVKYVTGLDVSNEISKLHSAPKNFSFLQSNGTTINLPPNSINLIYSNMLIEHLHYEDAFTQISNAFKVLVKGGTYICSTIHKYFGPGDVSLYFGNTPVGFHLKEYTNYDLYKVFKKSGFTKFSLFTSYRGIKIKLPIIFSIIIEALLYPFPHQTRKYLSKIIIFRKFINGQFIAIK